jgi:hypothetical protein
MTRGRRRHYNVHMSKLKLSRADTPILRSLQGLLKRGNPRDYKKHLVAKYLAARPARP